jgi:quercetin dioxygenase-like cupin family protein
MKKITIKLILCTALFFAVAYNNQQPINTEKAKMEKTESKNENTIFPKGEKAPAENFTGTVYVQMLAPQTENNNFSIASVSFEPSARTNWHTHPAGQTLLVLDGKGLYQERGKSVRTLNKGNVILCNPDIEHWHGASPESGMTHIAITNYQGDSQVNWLKLVTDEEYKADAK